MNKLKRTQISAIASAFSTLFAGQAIAADTVPVTRAQVKAELVEAINNGYTVVTESGRLAKDVFPANYTQESSVGKSREEVRQELAEAIESGLLDQHISA